jgi:hypothetical protein
MSGESRAVRRSGSTVEDTMLHEAEDGRCAGCSGPQPGMPPVQGAADAARTLWSHALVCQERKEFLDAVALLEGLLREFPDQAAGFPDLAERAAFCRERAGRPAHVPVPDPAAPEPEPCPVCATPRAAFERAQDKNWILCEGCGLLQYQRTPGLCAGLEKGEPGGANQPAGSLVHRREQYFCDLFLRELGFSDVLLYGIGWSLVFQTLRERGVAAVGCDLWRPLVEARQQEFGAGTFFHRDELPETRFDLISAFEVFEHFQDPLQDVGFLARRLNDEGLIFGCTDFWHGGSLLAHPGEPLYWTHLSHVTAWTWSSLRETARRLGLEAAFFKSDTRTFGAKVFFALHRGERVAALLRGLPKIFVNAY